MGALPLRGCDPVARRSWSRRLLLFPDIVDWRIKVSRVRSGGLSGLCKFWQCQRCAGYGFLKASVTKLVSSQGESNANNRRTKRRKTFTFANLRGGKMQHIGEALNQPSIGAELPVQLHAVCYSAVTILFETMLTTIYFGADWGFPIGLSQKGSRRGLFCF